MSYEFAGSLFRTERDLAVAIVAEFVSASGRNPRDRVEEYLADWTGLLAEMHCMWQFNVGQRDALTYYVDGARIGPGDVLAALYRDEDEK
jgi:hypothetical protein